MIRLQNATLAVINTEYSVKLTNVHGFKLKSANSTAFRIAYETGKVASSVDPYYTVAAGVVHEYDPGVSNGKGENITAYLAASVTDIIFIEVW